MNAHCVYVCLIPTVGRREHLILWMWSYKQFLIGLWVLGTELQVLCENSKCSSPSPKPTFHTFWEYSYHKQNLLMVHCKVPMFYRKLQSNVCQSLPKFHVQYRFMGNWVSFFLPEALITLLTEWILIKSLAWMLGSATMVFVFCSKMRLDALNTT